MRRLISSLLILVGLLTVAYPHLNRAYSRYMQEKALRELEQSILVGAINPEAEAEESFRNLEDVFQRELARQENPVEEPATPVEPPPPPPPPAPKPTALGILDIPKISSRMPIYYGTSNAILNIGIGQIKGTTPIGQIGNAALSAHRSYTYGHQFNRLDELTIGDEMTITVGQQSYVYRVYKIHVVEPTDTSVLNRNNRDKVLTLVTCTPIRPATHRLIVHALQISP